MYPNGLIKDRWGNITQKADPGERSVFWSGQFSSDEDAKNYGRELWKNHFTGKKKKLIILKQLEDNECVGYANNFEIIFEYTDA